MDSNIPLDDQLIGANDLAEWLGRSVSTIKADVSRRPHTLPPIIYLPGSNRPKWRRGAVKEWINQQTPL